MRDVTEIEWIIPGYSAFVRMERDYVDPPDGFKEIIDEPPDSQ
jgi:hypothetical protein